MASCRSTFWLLMWLVIIPKMDWMELAEISSCYPTYWVIMRLWLLVEDIGWGRYHSANSDCGFLKSNSFLKDTSPRCVLRNKFWILFRELIRWFFCLGCCEFLWLVSIIVLHCCNYFLMAISANTKKNKFRYTYTLHLTGSITTRVTCRNCR